MYENRTDSEDSILSSNSKIEKKNQGMQAMSWSILVKNGVQPQRGGANNSLFMAFLGGADLMVR
jgi:hypothetical protein